MFDVEISGRERRFPTRWDVAVGLTVARAIPGVVLREGFTQEIFENDIFGDPTIHFRTDDPDRVRETLEERGHWRNVVMWATEVQ